MTIPFIDIHTHHPVRSEGIISVHSLFLQDFEFNEIFANPFSAGIHPWHANRIDLEEIKYRLEQVISQHRLVAIGETGLDKKCKVNFDLQKAVFEQHIYFAKAFKKPLIIHCVNSWNEIMAFSEKSDIPFIFHGYKGNIELTGQLIHHGFFFSIGKALLNENHKIRESIKIIPVNSLFFETDDEIMDIKEIYNAAATILQCSAEDLKNLVFENYNRIILKSH